MKKHISFILYNTFPQETCKDVRDCEWFTYEEGD